MAKKQREGYILVWDHDDQTSVEIIDNRWVAFDKFKELSSLDTVQSVKMAKESNGYVLHSYDRDAD